MKRLAALTLFALSACATPLPQVAPRHHSDLFDVRFDARVQSAAQVDAKAREYCTSGAAEYASQENRFDGFTYRTYRCAGR